MKKFAARFAYFVILGLFFIAAGILLILLPLIGSRKTEKVRDRLAESLHTGEAVYINGAENADRPHPVEAGAFDSGSAFGGALAENELQRESTGKNALYCIGILSIPKIDVELPVVEGLTEEHLQYALAHMAASAAIGEEGSCCIFGHRSYAYGKFFNRLDELEEGDFIIIETADGALREYVVEKIEILLPDDPALLDGGLDGNILSLITCHPVRIATHRLVIRARELP